MFKSCELQLQKKMILAVPALLQTQTCGRYIVVILVLLLHKCASMLATPSCSIGNSLKQTFFTVVMNVILDKIRKDYVCRFPGGNAIVLPDSVELNDTVFIGG